MGIAALTSFTSDFFYNNDGTLTAEARAVVYGVIATVGTAAAGVAGSVLTNLWSKCTTQGNGTASIAAGSQNDNATGVSH